MNTNKTRPTKKGISVIIPTFNRIDYLYPTLICLLNQNTNFNYEILIVDSGEDETEKIIKILKLNDKENKIIYKKIKRNTNRSLIRNIGAKISKFDILCFLDNDMLVQPTFIQDHFDEHLKTPHLIALGKRHSLLNFDFSVFGEDDLIKNFTELSRLPAYYDERDNLNIGIQPWRFVFTHSVSLEKKDFYEAGGFNIKFGNNWGYEDLELGFRLQKIGCKFKLLENIVSYHQPHFIQSLNEQHSTKENSKLFFKLHNCFEIELYNALYQNFEEHYMELSNFEKDFIFPEKEIINKFDLIFGCLISSSQNILNKKMQLGCFCVYDNRQVNTLFIISNFFAYSLIIQISILSEAFRISKVVYFKKLNKKQIDIIYFSCLKLGYNISFSECDNYTLFTKIGNFNSRIYSIFLPDLLQPEKRYVYFWLANFLNKNDYLISILDGRKVLMFENEDYSSSDFYSLDLLKCVNRSYGTETNRYIVSWDMILTDDEKSFPQAENTIILQDENYEIKNKLLQNRLINQYTNFDKSVYSMLSFLSVYENVKEYKKSKFSKNSAMNFSFCTFMENGYKEDGIDLLLSSFAFVCQRKKNITLSIKLPNYEIQLKNAYPQHNQESKYDKIYYALQKYRLDKYKLMFEIEKLKLNQNVKIIEDNYNIHQIIDFINNHSGIIQIGRICCVPPQVYIAILLDKSVIIPMHQYNSIVNEMRSYCTFVKSYSNYFAEEMNVPNNCDFNKFLSFRVDIDSLSKLIGEVSNNFGTGKRINFQELKRKYENYIRAIF